MAKSEYPKMFKGGTVVNYGERRRDPLSYTMQVAQASVIAECTKAMASKLSKWEFR